MAKVDPLVISHAVRCVRPYELRWLSDACRDYKGNGEPTHFLTYAERGYRANLVMRIENHGLQLVGSNGLPYLIWLGQGLMDDGPGTEGIERVQEEPFLAPEMFYLSGYGGQRVYVDRENDLVVVRLGPFSGMQPLKPHWDNAFLLNTIIRGIRPERTK